jgi:hypothetical protein
VRAALFSLVLLVPSLSVAKSNLKIDSALYWCVICKGNGLEKWDGPRREQFRKCAGMFLGTGVMQDAFVARKYEPMECAPPNTLVGEIRGDFAEFCRFHLPTRDDRLGDYLVRFFAKTRPCKK